MQDVDFLTGCPNWIKFKRDVETLVKKDQTQPYAMIIFDVDKFKAIMIYTRSDR
jgi:GGDEF domain.